MGEGPRLPALRQLIDKSGALKAKGDRIGLYKCYACRKPFTVKIGTIFEKSHIQMRDWLLRDPYDLLVQKGRQR